MGLFGKKEKKVSETEVQDREKIEREQGVKWEDAPIPVKPLLNRVLILEYVGPEKTRGGLILPKSAQEGSLHEVVIGRVLEVGPGREHPQDADRKLPVSVERGQVVAYEKFKGMEFTKEGIKFRLCWDSDLLGTIPDYDTEEQYA